MPAGTRDERGALRIGQRPARCARQQGTVVWLERVQLARALHFVADPVLADSRPGRSVLVRGTAAAPGGQQREGHQRQTARTREPARRIGAEGSSRHGLRAPRGHGRTATAGRSGRPGGQTRPPERERPSRRGPRSRGLVIHRNRGCADPAAAAIAHPRAPTDDTAVMRPVDARHGQEAACPRRRRGRASVNQRCRAKIDLQGDELRARSGQDRAMPTSDPATAPSVQAPSPQLRHRPAAVQPEAA